MDLNRAVPCPLPTAGLKMYGRITVKEGSFRKNEHGFQNFSAAPPAALPVDRLQVDTPGRQTPEQICADPE